MAKVRKPEVEDKVWGAIEELYRDDGCRLVKARAVARGYCSKHLHQHMDNLFIVKEGRLRITVYQPDNPRGESTLLDKHRRVFIAPAGLKHRFECLADCVFYEFYLGHDNIPPVGEDIVRDDVGGLRG